MGAISAPLSVKLIVGMLSASREVLSEASLRLEREYGPIDVLGDVMAFDFTDYYDDEMGSGLLRQFVAFERLIGPDRIASIKRTANRMEEDFAGSAVAVGGGSGDGSPPGRPINIDPGYVTQSKLVLASAKDFAHRIYLAEGIYAEVTLTYVHGRWVSGPHTFPDYASGLYDGFLTRARDVLRQQVTGNRQND